MNDFLSIPFWVYVIDHPKCGRAARRAMLAWQRGSNSIGHDCGIHSLLVSEVLSKTETDFLKYCWIGKKSFLEIKTILQAEGLKFANKQPK